jgi:transposase InsO family protein
MGCDRLDRGQDRLHRTDASLEAVEYATLEWVDWFNNRRLLEPIGHVPPAEAEAAYYAAMKEPAALAA